MRVNANGRDAIRAALKRAMSSAMPRDRPMMPSFAVGVVGPAEITDQPGGRRHVDECTGILFTKMRAQPHGSC